MFGQPLNSCISGNLKQPFFIVLWSNLIHLRLWFPSFITSLMNIYVRTWASFSRGSIPSTITKMIKPPRKSAFMPYIMTLRGHTFPITTPYPASPYLQNTPRSVRAILTCQRSGERLKRNFTDSVEYQQRQSTARTVATWNMPPFAVFYM